MERGVDSADVSGQDDVFFTPDLRSEIDRVLNVARTARFSGLYLRSPPSDGQRERLRTVLLYVMRSPQPQRSEYRSFGEE